MAEFPASPCSRGCGDLISVSHCDLPAVLIHSYSCVPQTGLNVWGLSGGAKKHLTMTPVRNCPGTISLPILYSLTWDWTRGKMPTKIQTTWKQSFSAGFSLWGIELPHEHRRWRKVLLVSCEGFDCIYCSHWFIMGRVQMATTDYVISVQQNGDTLTKLTWSLKWNTHPV